MAKDGAKNQTKFTEKYTVLKNSSTAYCWFSAIETCQGQSELLSVLLDFGCFPLFL